VAAVCVATVAAASGPAAAPRLEAPHASELSLAKGTIVDRTLSPAAAARLASYWGASFQTSTGEEVTIQVSDAYSQDPAIAQRWANFLGSLIHGPELSSVIVYLAPPAEVESRCGDGALACYSPRDSLVIAPGEDPTRRISAEAVLAHEYGHHVAANRLNPPWPAIDWGTKRWASAEQVCARKRAGELFPGREDAIHYTLNPGEGVAESYRLLNERASGRAETPWLIVDDSLYPSPQALELLRQDVVSPWRANRVSTIRGAFTKSGPRSRTYSTSAAFDGKLEATLKAAGGARVSVAVLNSAGRSVARTPATSGSATARTTVCGGTRSFRLQVTRVSGAGRFQLSVSRP